ncbi:hypothetical protein AMTR_s00040p00034710 [Amborella trichopoda]|uniref:Uncharacterized protein n=1 Tax=Amborella trichopoda TaxID=13333 RepID=W1PSG6_AMBTC|nr:hypothetical protein AMTR_s00040p00034710 [Amborella trichopoda]
MHFSLPFDNPSSSYSSESSSPVSVDSSSVDAIDQAQVRYEKREPSAKVLPIPSAPQHSRRSTKSDIRSLDVI